MHYDCSACGRPVGLMADKYGTPQEYYCPHAARNAHPQTPVKRGTTIAPEILTRLRIKRRDIDD